MGCTKCKEKNKTKVDLYNGSTKSEHKLVIFFVIWSLFAIYGIISFIKLFL